MGVTHSLRRWPLRNVTIDGVSLLDHERRHMQNQKELQANTRPRKGPRKYEILARSTPSVNEPKRQRFLGEESIREIATKNCCMHRCCQLFPRKKLKAIREEMWLGDFRLRSIKKLDVHRAIHVVLHGTPFTVCPKRNFIDKPVMPRKATAPVTMRTWG